MDELDYIAAPRQTEILLGLTKEQGAFVAAFQSGRLHHAWLLAGPASAGKATFAYQAAKYLLHETSGGTAEDASSHGGFFGNEDVSASTPNISTPPDSATAAQVSVGSHPNLLVLSRRYDEDTKRITTGIPVGDVRRLTSFFGSTAGAGGWRVVIVDKVDDMAAPAANALLKSLEEPPTNCLFFLITDNPDRLLPTIRSRCRRLDFQRPDEAHMQRVLQQVSDGFDADAYRSITSVADGRIARAMELLDDGNDAIRSDMQAQIQALPETDPAHFHPLAEKLAARGKEALYAEFMERADLYVHTSAIQHAAERSGQTNPWLDVWDTVNIRHSETNTFNLDKKQLILDVFALLNRAKRAAAI